MKKAYLLFGVGALAFILANQISKYKKFADQLSFSLKKVKLDSKFPFTNFRFIITLEAYNPTETQVTLKSLYGTLLLQGKTIANISSTTKLLKQGRNTIEVFADMSISQVNDIIGSNWNTTNVSGFLNQVINEPFTTDLTYVTSIGTFSSKDNWKLKDFA